MNRIYNFQGGQLLGLRESRNISRLGGVHSISIAIARALPRMRRMTITHMLDRAGECILITLWLSGWDRWLPWRRRAAQDLAQALADRYKADNATSYVRIA